MDPQSSIHTFPVTPRTVDVVVIGAGLSGLRAALGVQAAGLSCVVLEATDRVGGMTLSISSKQSGPGVNDVGAAWINDTTQSEMYKLLQRYGLQGQMQACKGKDIFQSPNGYILSPHGELPIPEEEQLAVSEVFVKLRELIANVDLEDPSLGPNAKELDNVTLYEYCIRTFQSEAIADLFDYTCQALVGVEGNAISMLSFLHACKSGTGIDALTSDGKDGAQYLRVRQGTQAFSQNMAAELKPGTLYLSTPVTQITQIQSQSIDICTVQTATSTTFHAKKIILSIATPLYPTITFTPPLPPQKQRLAHENKLGYYCKIIFIFPHPFWRPAGLSGTIHADAGPFLFTMDTSIPDDNQWSLSCFAVGPRGREWSLHSEEERRRSAWTQLRSAFENVQLPPGQEVSVPDPISVLEYDWSKQEFFWGGPVPASPPGLLSGVDGDAVRAAFGNVHFVGTETSLVWKGYMEGAVRSGDRGAREVGGALGV
ncbi:hypothetical protein BDV23DRAFT_190852 [Aspergillus alliaceus]|uniref:Amine oxidase n=1 Tax=Petromyces alliaceus TaxID=209559 RepID=A0A5N7BUA0_PETAA|nr:hypothetical protein BDV23DRAFT_190852 [Aspergillus alliaceus]